MKTIILTWVISVLLSLSFVSASNGGEIIITGLVPVSPNLSRDIEINITPPELIYEIGLNKTWRDFPLEMNITPGSLDVPLKLNMTDKNFYVKISPIENVSIKRDETWRAKPAPGGAPVPGHVPAASVIPTEASPAHGGSEVAGNTESVMVSDVSINTEGGKTVITANVESNGEKNSIRIEKTPGKINLESGGVKAETENVLELDSSGIFIKRGETAEKIEIMPDKVNETLKELVDFVETMEIGFKEKPVYSVKGRKSGNLLWLAPVTFDVEVEVNTKTGEVENVVTPWWSFLAF